MADNSRRITFNVPFGQGKENAQEEQRQNAETCICGHKRKMEEVDKDVKKLREEVKELQETVKHQTHLLTQQSETLAQQTVFLQRLVEKAFPQKRTFDLLPIKTLEMLEEIDRKASSLPRAELIQNILELIGATQLHKCLDLFFDAELMLKINWDGNQNKFAVKNINFFSTLVFEAVKTADFGFKNFEEEMRKGFRTAKCKLYRKKYDCKEKPSA